MYILLTVLHIFLMLLVGRFCIKIKAFHLWWLFLLFSWLKCLIKQWHCKEKLDFGHHWGSIQHCHIYSGLPRSGKNTFSSRSEISTGILYRQGNTKFYLKVSEESEYFIFGSPSGLGKGFLVGKGNVVSKDIYKGADFCGFDRHWLICQKFVFCVLENWFVVNENVRERSGNFYPDKWQPWHCTLLLMFLIDSKDLKICI